MSVFMKRNRFPQIELPYKKLDYIQSTGTQYIDTLYNPNQNTGIIMDAQILSPETIHVRIYFSTFDGTNRYALWDSSSSNNLLRWHYGSINTNTWDVEIEKRRTVNISGTTAIVDNVEKTYSSQTFNIGKTLLLGADNNNGTIRYSTALKIYSCQIYDNNVMVRDYIPVIMRNTKEIGLWDKVNRQFYGNAGTGKFIAGEVAA